MAFRPTLLSNALVIHDPILRFSVSEIHSLVPRIPPCSDGFSTKYCGAMVSRSSSLSASVLVPISSSSSAMGKGDRLHKSAISFHRPLAMGCSMEWRSSAANFSSFDKASAGAKAPFASTRSSTWRGENVARMSLSNCNSRSKSIAPIFNFTHLNP